MTIEEMNAELTEAAGERVHYEYEIAGYSDIPAVSIFQHDDAWEFPLANYLENPTVYIEKIHPRVRQWCKERRGHYSSVTEAAKDGYIPTGHLK